MAGFTKEAERLKFLESGAWRISKGEARTSGFCGSTRAICSCEQDERRGAEASGHIPLVAGDFRRRLALREERCIIAAQQAAQCGWLCWRNEFDENSAQRASHELRQSVDLVHLEEAARAGRALPTRPPSPTEPRAAAANAPSTTSSESSSWDSQTIHSIRKSFQSHQIALRNCRPTIRSECGVTQSSCAHPCFLLTGRISNCYPRFRFLTAMPPPYQPVGHFDKFQVARPHLCPNQVSFIAVNAIDQRSDPC